MFTPPNVDPPAQIMSIKEKEQTVCSLGPDMSCALEKTVGLLRDEVIRLNQSVARLEIHAAGTSVRARDISLTIAGVSLAVACAVWVIQRLV